MRVLADLDRCIGSGNCELLAPDVFEVGRTGSSGCCRPKPGRADEDAVRDAVAQCPTGALTLPT